MNSAYSNSPISNSTVSLAQAELSGFPYAALAYKPLIHLGAENVNNNSGQADIMYDQSGNGYDFTQGTLTKCPLIETRRGVPALSFGYDNSEDVLLKTVVNGYAGQSLGQSDLTVIQILEMNGTPVNFTVNNSLLWNVAENNLQVYFNSSGYFIFRNNTGNLQSPTIPQFTPFAIIWRKVRNTSVELFVNNSLVASSTAAASTADFTNGTQYLMSRNSSANYFKGWLYSYIVYDRAISNDEINQTYNFLRQKYNFR